MRSERPLKTSSSSSCSRAERSGDLDEEKGEKVYIKRWGKPGAMERRKGETGQGGERESSVENFEWRMESVYRAVSSPAP